MRSFRNEDLGPFAALNTHPLVVASLGSSPTRAESDAMVERFSAEMAVEGWGMWAVEVVGGAAFIGMVGLHRVNAALPCAPAVEVAWRFSPDHWGLGYATEGATLALHYGLRRLMGGDLPEIVAFTSASNVRSQAVMGRIGMVRDVGADFDHPSLPESSTLRRHVLYRSVREAPEAPLTA